MRVLSIRVNGTTEIAKVSQLSPGSTYGVDFNLATEWEMAAGDYVELVAFHDPGQRHQRPGLQRLLARIRHVVHRNVGGRREP